MERYVEASSARLLRRSRRHGIVPPATGRAEHDQLPDHHLGGRYRHPILLEAVILHPPLDVEAIPLADIILRHLRQSIPESEPMPFGPVLEAAIPHDPPAR